MEDNIVSLKDATTKALSNLKARNTGPPPVEETPANVAAARKAARLGELQYHENWQRMATMTTDALKRSLGQRYSRERTNLDAFEIYHKSQETAVASVRTFLADLESVLRDGRSLILYGAVGTGKDHLLAAALYRASTGTIPTQWLSGQEFYGRIRDSMDTGEREESLMEKWDGPAVLGISDPIPPIGKPSEWNTAQLYRIIDRRYRAMRCTWVSLNAMSQEDADAKLSAPIFDRLRDGATLVPCFWPSYRERKKP